MSQGQAEDRWPPVAGGDLRLPAEIGFLALHGTAPAVLHGAAIIARLTRTSADRVLLSTGAVDEDEFYRALARELRLPFVARPRLSAARYPESILTGIAPLASHGGGYVAAPQGRRIQALFTQRPAPGALALTTPGALMRAVLAKTARRVADQASHRLPDTAPGLSSRDGSSYAQIGIYSGLSLVLSFLLTADPVLGLVILAAALGPLYFGMVALRLACALLARPAASPPVELDDAALPVYTVIVALYRERQVAPRLISALSRLHYPAAKLDIKLVLEQDDQDTRDALAALDLPGYMEVIVAPEGLPRTKPRALNVALPLARGQLLVLYDAEDVPDPAQLRQAAAAFARLPASVACLQARLVIDNTRDSLITRFFTIEYAALFDVVNPGLAELGCPLPLGGTSNHFRVRALRRAGGWDAWNVTEDADLGIRLARLGFAVGDLPSSTLEEAPITLSAWMHQRTRWMKGYMQTCICHSRHPARTLRELGLWRFLGAIIVSFGTVISALGYPVFTALSLMAWTVPPDTAIPTWLALWNTASATLFWFGLAAVFVPACIALAHRRLWSLLPWVPLLPLYYILVSLAAWRGAWELIRSPFHWRKTSHGLARTSRTGPLQKHQAKADRTMSLKTEPP